MMELLRTQWRTAAARTDPHSIAMFNPADYEYVAFYDLNEIVDLEDARKMSEREGQTRVPGWMIFDVTGVNFSLLDAFEDMQNQIRAQSWHGRWFERQGCDHCGASRLRNVNAYRHKPTGDIIVIGSTCSIKADLPNRNAYELAAANQREETRKRNAERLAKWEKWRLTQPEDAAIVDQVAKAIEGGLRNGFWESILRGIKQYGAPTERQMSALAKSWEEAQAEIAEQEAPTLTVTSPCPSGAQTIQGTVVSTKWQESDYGGSLKCLVEDHRGFRVWGTVPGAVHWQKGDEVRFVATIEPSDDDPFFGFYKRPRTIEERDESGRWHRASLLIDDETGL